MLNPVYDPHNWHWIVAGDETRYWSSATGGYVEALPDGAGVTRIASEQELAEVLRPHGLTLPVYSQSDFQHAIQMHVDGVAVAKLYNDGNALAGYVNSTVPQWASEAQAFVSWRDSVWLHAYAELDKVQNGSRPAPSVEAFLEELPDIDWNA